MMRRTLLGMLGSLVGVPLTGDGLVRPQNAPPAGQLVPGVQPGTTPGVISAALVIVKGTNGGVFVYDSATGKLIGSISNAATDPVNDTAIQPVIAAYSTVDGSYVELAPGSSGGGAPSVYVSSGDSAEQTPARVLAQVSGAGPTRKIVTTARAPRVTGEAAGAACSLSLISPAADLSAGVLAQLIATNDGINISTVNLNQAGPSLAGTTDLLLSVGALQFELFGGTATVRGGPLISTAGTLASPTIVTNEAGWTLATLINGWANAGGGLAPMQYRLTTDNKVHLIGVLNPAALTATRFMTLPAGYRPATSAVEAGLGFHAAVGAAAGIFLRVGTTGNCDCFNAVVGSGNMAVNAIIPLDGQ